MMQNSIQAFQLHYPLYTILKSPTCMKICHYADIILICFYQAIFIVFLNFIIFLIP